MFSLLENESTLSLSKVLRVLCQDMIDFSLFALEVRYALRSFSTNC